VSSPSYPVPPRVRFRVGVTGHRGPPKLPLESEAPVRSVLDQLLALVVKLGRQAANAYAECAPAQPFLTGTGATPDGASAAAASCDFVVVSSIAEGADRLVAEAGLAAGFTLEVVLPFKRAQYQRDFTTAASHAAYEKLIQRAAAVFELDGNVAESPRAYETAGFIMLANIDLLIVIWDGNLASGIGGTAQIVSRAIGDGIPIVWIQPTNPEALHLSWSPPGEVPAANAYTRPNETFRAADKAEVGLAIREMLALPSQPEALDSLKRYLHTKERRWNFCLWYPVLSWLFSGRPLGLRDFYLPPAVDDTRAKWRHYLAAVPEDRAQRPAIETVLLPACGLADHLANYYSLVYRSTYIFNFLFAAVAVALALDGIFVHEPETKSYFVLAELAIILIILFTWLYGHRQQWHRRWLECRRLGECLRHLRIFAPLGAAGSVDRPRCDLNVDEQDWINWYAWSLRRQLPLPASAVDGPYLEKLRDAVRNAEIKDQIDYHRRTAARMSKLDHRIHLGGYVLFGITAALCIVFVCLVWFGTLRHVEPSARDLLLGSLTFLTALLPTLGAALGAIHAQGDFNTLAEQSGRTAERLAAIDKVLAEEQITFSRLLDRIEKTSDVMMSDLLEWHTVFRTRSLTLPA
jgi:hypothetical protein